MTAGLVCPTCAGHGLIKVSEKKTPDGSTLTWMEHCEDCQGAGYIREANI